MAKVKSKETETIKQKNLRRELITQMLTLATSALGLVAALAWNEFIRELVNQYIKPFVGGSSGLISLAIYSLIVTILAVSVTYYLSKVKEKI